jgi:Zn-dependent protease with chaperone function
VAFIALDELAGRPVLPLPAPPPSALPRRGAAGRALFAALTLYTVVAAVALQTVPADLRLDVGGGLLVVLAVDVPLVELMRGIATRRVRVRLARLAPTTVELPATVAAVVARYGIRELSIRMQVGVAPRDRAFRVGRRAWVVLGHRTVHRGEFRSFVLCHEIGHVVRDDSRIRRITYVVASATILVLGLLTDGPTLAVAVGLTLLAFVAEHWLAELACDAFAVRWVGVEAFRAWATPYRARLGRAARLGLRSRLRIARGLLTHPPMGLRLWWAERVAASS